MLSSSGWQWRIKPYDNAHPRAALPDRENAGHAHARCRRSWPALSQDISIATTQPSYARGPSQLSVMVKMQ